MSKLVSKEFYLIVGSRKKQFRSYIELLTPRIVVGTKSQSPKLNAGEIAIKVNLELPAALFEKPAFKAKVTVPASSVSAPVIEADVINNITQAIAQQTGIQLTIEQVPAQEN